MGMQSSATDSVDATCKLVRKVAVSVIGVTLLIVGVVMIVAPGPALLVIPAGLAILGVEYAWARRLLRRLRKKISDSGKRRRAARAVLHQNRDLRI